MNLKAFQIVKIDVLVLIISYVCHFSVNQEKIATSQKFMGSWKSARRKK